LSALTSDGVLGGGVALRARARCGVHVFRVRVVRVAGVPLGGGAAQRRAQVGGRGGVGGDSAGDGAGAGA